MPFIGSSTFNTANFIAAGGGNQGPSGPRGATGSTGNTGPTGPTGNTGTGVSNIIRIDNNTVQVVLTDGSTINLSGLSGPAPSASDTGTATYDITKIDGSPLGSNEIFLVNGPISGKTASFKVFSGIGITLQISGNDLVFSAPSVLPTGSLQNNAVLGISGITGIVFVNSEATGAFSYRRVLSGITTYDIAETTISTFLQSLNNNINATGTNPISVLSNRDIVINQFYYDTASSIWKNKNIIKLTGADQSDNDISISFTNDVFDSTKGVTYPFIESIGSCCFCNILGRNYVGGVDVGTTRSDRVCFDYVSKQACTNIGGSFSSIASCYDRAVTEPNVCGPMAVPGVCCTCGTNNSAGAGGNNGTCTDQLSESLCKALFGDAAWNSGKVCAEVNCGTPCTSVTKKKIIKTSDKGYPSRYTCGITDEGNVVCWGPLISSFEITVRNTVNPNQDYFTTQIAVGENQVVILSQKVKRDEFGNILTDIYGIPLTDSNLTKVDSRSFLPKPVQSALQANSNIFRAAFASFSPAEYYSRLTNKFIPGTGRDDYYPPDRPVMFIGLQYPNRQLFADGVVVDSSNAYVIQNNIEPLVPLPQGEFREVSANTQHVCGILADSGRVVCWGSNDFGQTNYPAELRELDNIAVGRFHTVALTTNGNVVCWGAGSTMGNGGDQAKFDKWPHYGQSKVPDDLYGKKVIQIGAGYYYSAALLEDGNVRVWGSFRGFTTDGGDLQNINFFRDDVTRELVKQPEGNLRIKEIVCTPYSIVGLKEDGTLLSWGDDSGFSGVTGYGLPSKVRAFYEALDNFGIENRILFEQIAASDDIIYGLQNIYKCPGVTYIPGITNPPDPYTGGGPQGAGVGGGVKRNPKTLLLYKKPQKDCINCLETTFDEYEGRAKAIFNDDEIKDTNFIGITYPWEPGEAHTATTYSSEIFYPSLQGYGTVYQFPESEFTCFNGATHIWKNILTNDPQGISLGEGISLASQFWNDEDNLYNTCSDLDGCNLQSFGVLVTRNPTKACLQCKKANECVYENIRYTYGNTYARFYPGENLCYDSINKKYIWEKDTNPLPDIFKDFDGNVLSACADLDGDGISNNDQDDICTDENQILSEQYVWKLEYPSYRQWNELNPQIHNVKCLNRNEGDQFWAPADIAYGTDFSSLKGLCYYSTAEILTKSYLYRDIKQEIFLLSNSGVGVYYVMKPDSVYMDGNRIINYSVLNPEKVKYFSTTNKYINGTVGFRTEISTVYEKTNTNREYKIQTDPYNRLDICDPNIESFIGPRYYDFNLDNCSPAPSNNSNVRVPLVNIYGFGHGVEIKASFGCDLGNTATDCSTGYARFGGNATGLTALNPRITTEWKNPITVTQEFTTAVKSSRLWGVTAEIKIKGYTYTIENTGNPGLNQPDKILSSYSASCGYYHSCIVVDEPIRLFAGLTAIRDTSGEIIGSTYEKSWLYNPGDVVCWGAGEDPKRTSNAFNYGQAFIEPLTDGLTALEVSCGVHHTAVLLSNGTLKLFGLNEDGQVSNNSGITSFQHISCGSYHTIGVYDGTKVVGWGSGNGYLDLDLGNYSYKQLSNPPIKIVSGRKHNIFLLKDGFVECSGSNEVNQCQVCTDPVFNKKKYIWVDAKDDATVAVDTDGILYLFGNIKNNVEAIPEILKQPPEGRRIISVATGEEHSLALLGFKDDPLNLGEIYGWGNNPSLNKPPYIDIAGLASGSVSNTTALVHATDKRPLTLLGDGSYVPYILENVFKMGLIGATGMSLKTIDEIVALGGPKGTTATEYFNFIRKEKLKDPRSTQSSVSKISAGGLRSFAIKDLLDVKYTNKDIGLQRRLISWGRNYTAIPKKIDSIFTNTEWISDPISKTVKIKRIFPVEVSCSNLFVVIKIREYTLQIIPEVSEPLIQDRYVIHFDDDVKTTLIDNGTLFGVTDSDPLYGELRLLQYEKDGKIYKNFSKVSAGGYHILGIINEPGDPLHKTIATWGLKGTIEDKGQFEIPFNKKFKDISAGQYHNIGILDDSNPIIDNTLYCWGAGTVVIDDDEFDLGQSIPPSGVKAKKISAGGFHSLAILEDDTVVGWGAGSSNFANIYGAPHYKQSIIPTDFGGTPLKARDISAGTYHSLAVTLNDNLKAWGSNESNETSISTINTEKYIAVAAGNGYSLALTQNGGVIGWGYGSAESPEASIATNSRYLGNSILSALPPNGTTDVVTRPEEGIDNYYVSNRFGENDVIVYVDTTMARSRATSWGDNSFKQTEIPTAILQNNSDKAQDINDPIWFPFNAGSEEEGFADLQINYTTCANYGSNYFSGYCRPSVINSRYGPNNLEKFISGSGLNSGINWEEYLRTGTKKYWPLSKINGITGISIPIFADVVSATQNIDKIGKEYSIPFILLDREKFLLSNSAYFGVKPEAFYILNYNDTGVLQNLYRSDVAKHVITGPNQFPNFLSEQSFSDGKTFSFYDESAITNGSKINDQFGIHWGLKTVNNKITIGKYDWVDAYSFALGWNPFTNEPVNYFDLHHNLWNIKLDLKTQLNETGCTDCNFIKDIKAGFTPLESLSGRYGLKVIPKVFSSANLQSNFTAYTKVCGKMDLNDSRINEFVTKVSIEDVDGTTKDFYLLDASLLFGANQHADIRYEFPFTSVGNVSDRDPGSEPGLNSRTLMIQNAQKLTEIGIKQSQIWNFEEKNGATAADNALCNNPQTTDYISNGPRWLLIPDIKSNQELQVCFTVNGICSFGDNSRGQFGGTTGNSYLLSNYTPKKWIPSFLMPVGDEFGSGLGTNIKSGVNHSILHINNGYGNFSLSSHFTYQDPIIKYKNFHTKWQSDPDENHLSNIISDTLKSSSGVTAQPGSFIRTIAKPVHKGIVIVPTECGRNLGYTGDTGFLLSTESTNNDLLEFNTNQVRQTYLLNNTERYNTDDSIIYAGRSHIAIEYKDTGITLIGDPLGGKLLNVVPYDSEVFGELKLDQLKSVSLSLGYDHNVVYPDGNYTAFDSGLTLAHIVATVNRDNNTIDCTWKDVETGQVYKTETGISNNYDFPVGETINWLVCPALVWQKWPNGSWIDGITKSYGGYNSIIFWGNNTNSQVYDSNYLEYAPKFIDSIEEGPRVSRDENPEYQILNTVYYPLNTTNKFDAGSNHTALISSPPAALNTLGPDVFGMVARVSPGYTYANYKHKIEIIGDNSLGQKDLPPEFTTSLSGITVFELNVGGEITDVCVSFDNKYIAYVIGKQRIVIVDGEKALSGILDIKASFTTVGVLNASKQLVTQNIGTVNSIKFSTDNILYIGNQEGYVLYYDGLEDNIKLKLEYHNSKRSGESRADFSPDETPGEIDSYTLSLRTQKYLNYFDRSNEFKTGGDTIPLGITLTANYTDGTSQTLSLRGGPEGVSEYEFVGTSSAINLTWPIKFTKTIFDYFIVELPRIQADKTNGLYNFGSPVNKITITEHSRDHVIAAGLDNGTVAYRKLKNKDWLFLKQPGNNTPVTAIAWGSNITDSNYQPLGIGTEFNFEDYVLLLGVGHKNGVINGWLPLTKYPTNEITPNYLSWSSRYGSLNSNKLDLETERWCSLPLGEEGQCPGSTYSPNPLCRDDITAGECMCFSSGEITSLEFVGYQQGFPVSNKLWEGIIFTSKNYDPDTGEVYGTSKCNPEDKLYDQRTADTWFGATAAFRYMHPRAGNNTGIRTKYPALLGKITVNNSVETDENSQIKLEPIRTYFNSDHLEWDNNLHKPGYTFDIDTGYTGGHILLVKTCPLKRTIYSIGSDNDIRAERIIFKEIPASPLLFNVSYFDGLYDSETNICNGDRDSEGRPIKDDQITCAHSMLDEVHLISGTKSGKLRIWNTENKYIFSSHPKIKPTQISCGKNHTCVSYGITDYDISMICWGDNSKNQCTPSQEVKVLGSRSRSPFFKNNIYIGIGPTPLECGGDNSCITNVYGNNTCWGDNTYGQLQVNNVSKFSKYTAIGDGFIGVLRRTYRVDDCADPDVSAQIGGTVAVYGRNAELFNNIPGIHDQIVAGKNVLLTRYNPLCGYTGPRYTDAWDIYGKKISCTDDPNLLKDTSIASAPYAALTSCARRYDINGFNTVYGWGDNTYNQCDWPAPNKNSGFTGVIYNYNAYRTTQYHPQEIFFPDDPGCRNCWSKTKVGYQVDCYSNDTHSIGYAGFNQLSLSTGYFPIYPDHTREHVGHISVGGYHNLAFLSAAYHRDNLIINPLVITNQPRDVYGWGNNIYGQTDIINIPSTSTAETYQNYGQGTLLASKYGSIAGQNGKFTGVGATFTNQLNYIPYYSDFGIGNGYSVYSHQLGYVLFKYIPRIGWDQRWTGPHTIQYAMTDDFFDRCAGSPYPPVKSYRTVKKIRAGRDYCLFLSNEGKVITPFCHYEVAYDPKLPRHFGNVVGLTDFNINVPPTQFSQQPLADIQIGHFHVIALTTDNRILMWGVSPSTNFSRQYYQTVIPPGLDRSRAVVQIAAGKYHSTAVLASISDNKYNTTLRSFGEPESSN